MKLQVKKEFKGMMFSKFDRELGLKITIYPDLEEMYCEYYENFQKRGFDIFEEVEEVKKKRKYTKRVKKD